MNLLDLNDNDPTFRNLPFVAEILEGTPAGVSVYQVSVGLTLPCPCGPRGISVCLTLSIFMRARDAS